MVVPGTTLAREAADVLKDFGIPVAETSIGQRQVFRQSAVYGSTVHSMKDPKAVEEVEALAAEALAILGGRQ